MSRFFRHKDGFPMASSVESIEIGETGVFIHFRNGKKEQTMGYTLEMCERFVTQGKWEEIKS